MNMEDKLKFIINSGYKVPEFDNMYWVVMFEGNRFLYFTQLDAVNNLYTRINDTHRHSKVPKVSIFDEYAQSGMSYEDFVLYKLAEIESKIDARK